MKVWWLTNFARVAIEKSAVERLAAEERWFTLSQWRINEFRLSVEGDILAHGARYPVRLVYPDQFPSVPAWVQPQDPEAKWSTHQYGKGGSLCLELRPDNWLSAASGADVLRSAYNLLVKENPLGEGVHERVQSAHHIGEIQSYDWNQYPILIGKSCLERIRGGTAEDLRGLRWMAADDVWPILISDAGDSTGSQRPPSVDIGTWRFGVPVVLARCEPPSTTPADRAALGAVLGVDLSNEALSKGAIVVIAIGAERVVPYHSPDEAAVYARKWVMLPDQSGLRSGRTTAALGKSVAVVGVGSVGSKIAEMLLRSGVDQLVLVDGDVFLPANLERHILDWRDVGFRKAHAVKRRLLHIAPGAQIEVIDESLNWQRSARTHAQQIEAITNCDFIVDATGDLPSAFLLGALAFQNGQPFVSAEVFEGGLGALVARSIPGRDPPYVAGRAAYTAYCDKMNVQPPTSGYGTYEALSEAGKPIVADDVAVTIAAAHAARVILDILDERVGTMDAAFLLIGCRVGWLFERHGHTISLDVGPPPSESTAVDDADSRAFVLALAQEALNAAASSS